MNLHCPKCKELIARQVSSGRFHVLVSNGKNKKQLNKLRTRMKELICQTPVIVECAKKKHDSNGDGKAILCGCVTKGDQILAIPYRPKRHKGQWLKVKLEKTKGYIECADARAMCPTTKCEEEMFLKEFSESGKSLGTATTRKLAWTEYRDGQPWARALDDPPNEWLDYDV